MSRPSLGRAGECPPIPNRSREVPDDPSESLWSSRSSFAFPDQTGAAGRKNDAETVERRRERVLLLHVSGKSPRELAYLEGVSLSQVYRDIKESAAGIRKGLLRGDGPAATRMIMLIQEITARAMEKGRYGAALRALEMELRIRMLLPIAERWEREETGPPDDPEGVPVPCPPWPDSDRSDEGAALLGTEFRQRGSPR